MSDTDPVSFTEGDARRIVAAVKRVEAQPPTRLGAAGMVGKRERGSAGATRVFVSLQNPTGEAGGPGVPCAYHYDVYTLDGSKLIKADCAMTGNGQRVLVGPTYTPGTVGSGNGSKDEFVLRWADEIFPGIVCVEEPP